MIVTTNLEDNSPKKRSFNKDAEKGNCAHLMYWILERMSCWARLFWPVSLAIGLMLPRLASAHFGLLDDGVTLAGSAAIINDHMRFIFTLGGQSGRFSPIILLFYALVYWVGGYSAFFFFCVNTLILAAIAVGLIWLIHSLTGSKIQAWITSLLFVFSGPVVESFYTVTKGEPLQVIWILASFVLLRAYGRIGGKRLRALAFMGILTALFLAMSTKETGVVIMPISLAWFLTGLWWKRRNREQVELRSRFAYMLAALIAGIAFFALRAHYVSEALTGGTYTQSYRFEWGSMAVSASRWFGWLSRDFPYLLPILVFLTVALFHKKINQRWILSDCTIWMLAWIVVFLPWPSSLDYYFLPFALGSALFCGSAITQMLALVNSTDTAGWLRVTAKSCLTIGVALICVTISNNVTNLRLQLAYDEANADIVDFLAKLPPNSRIVANIPQSSEYFFELGLHLSSLKQRPDLKLEPCQGPACLSAEGKHSFYILIPEFDNQLLPSVRIGLDEATVKAWNQAVIQVLGTKPEVVYRTERHVQLLDFGLHRYVCLLSQRAIGLFCNYPRHFVEAGVCRYGWKVYRISESTASSNHLSLAKVKVWGAADLALGKRAAQSSTALGATADRAVDGNTSGNWGDGSLTHTNAEAQPWWQVDLQTVQSIQTIQVWNRTDCCSDRLSAFYVFVSDVPFASSDLTTTLNQSGVSGFYTSGQGGSPTTVTVNRTGRYVRIQLTGSNYLSLAEVQVWSSSSGQTDLASGKRATQSSTVLGATADRAVDGNTSGNWGDGSLTHTNAEAQPWWQVDLQTVQSIQTIQVWNRTDCCSDRLSAFYVFVSDVPFASSDLTTTLNQSGVSGFYTSGQGGSPTTTTVSRTGRYVRIQLTGSNYLSLAEVQIWSPGN